MHDSYNCKHIAMDDAITVCVVASVAVPHDGPQVDAAHREMITYTINLCPLCAGALTGTFELPPFERCPQSKH